VVVALGMAAHGAVEGGIRKAPMIVPPGFVQRVKSHSSPGRPRLDPYMPKHQWQTRRARLS
jgi:hypothetical protein